MSLRLSKRDLGAPEGCDVVRLSEFRTSLNCPRPQSPIDGPLHDGPGHGIWRGRYPRNPRRSAPICHRTKAARGVVQKGQKSSKLLSGFAWARHKRSPPRNRSQSPGTSLSGPEAGNRAAHSVARIGLSENTFEVRGANPCRRSVAGAGFRHSRTWSTMAV